MGKSSEPYSSTPGVDSDSRPLNFFVQNLIPCKFCIKYEECLKGNFHDFFVIFLCCVETWHSWNMLCRFVGQHCNKMDGVRNEGNEKHLSRHTVTDYKHVRVCGAFNNSVSDNKE